MTAVTSVAISVAGSDQEARRLIQTDLDETYLVEASAGCGKTSALVSRIVALIESGKGELSRIVALTFTEKAAGEMKLRLRREIERARNRASGPSKARLDKSLAELEIAAIGTLHGFCADLLRERPVEAGVDPKFVVCDEAGQERLYREAFDEWLTAEIAAPRPGTARVLRRRARDHQDRTSARELLFDAGQRILAQRDFDGAWQRPKFDREALQDGLLLRLADLAELANVAAHPDDILAKGIFHAQTTYNEIARRERVVGVRDRDAVDEGLRSSLRGWQGKLWTYRGYKSTFGGGHSRDSVVQKRDALRHDLEAYLLDADAELAALLREELRSLVTAYEAALERAASLDFLDLLLRARALLASSEKTRRELQGRYTHILIDEFQDTDPLQVDILALLAADDATESDPARALPVRGKLFFVGDPKQSIYRFRRADVRLYEHEKSRLVAAGGKVLYLTRSFRSTQSVQALVNAAFGAEMRASAVQSRYSDLTGGADDLPQQPAVVALPIPAPYSEKSGKVSPYAVSQSFPDAAAAYVEWLVRESGYKVRQGEALVPLCASHICLLFRRFSAFGEDVVRPYVRSLEARRIPHVHVGGKTFSEREEIRAIENAAGAIEWPDDELAVLATLKGPFFALSDEALLVYRHAVHHALDPLTPVTLDGAAPHAILTAPVQDALTLLGRLHAMRNHVPIAQTLSELLEETRAHAGMAFWPAGEQALANVLKLIGKAHAFEAQGTTSFRAFAEYLIQVRERGGAKGAELLEEETAGVRIMTVHKAKGLEFPVVILCDPGCALTQKNPTRYVDVARKVWAMPLCGAAPLELSLHHAALDEEERAEALRLAYVAATRARDMLVVPVVGEGPQDGWLQVFSAALYPEPRRYRTSERADYLPNFGAESVVVRPPASKGATTVQPGVVIPRIGTHRVVFWDPCILQLAREEEVGVRQQKLLAPDKDETRVREGVAAYETWRTDRAANLGLGMASARSVVPVTAELIATDSAVAPTRPKAVPTSATKLEVFVLKSSRSTAGVDFGSLVHAVLARVDLNKVPDDLEGFVGSCERVVGSRVVDGRAPAALASEITDATACVRAFLSSALVERILKADEVRRECHVYGALIEGVVAAGIVDLAFRKGERWVVVDYKTDDAADTLEQRYGAQIRAYAAAIASASGLPCDAILVAL